MLLECIKNTQLLDILYDTLIMKKQKNIISSLCIKIIYKNKENFETKIPQ